MALIKASIDKKNTLPEFNTLDEAIEYYKSESEIENRHYAIEKILDFSEGAKELVKLIEIESEQKSNHIIVIIEITSLKDISFSRTS